MCASHITNHNLIGDLDLYCILIAYYCSLFAFFVFFICIISGVAWWVYFLSAVVILLLCGSIILLYRLWLIKQLKNELRYEVFEEVKSQLGARIQTQHKESLSIPSLNSDYATTNHPTSYSAVEFPNNRYTTDP